MSVDCLFSFKLRFSWFLVWHIIFFFIASWTFWYYIMRFCILFKFSVLAGLSDTALVGKGRCHFFMTGRGESLGFPLGLHWHLGEGGSSVSPWVLCWHHTGWEREGHFNAVLTDTTGNKDKSYGSLTPSWRGIEGAPCHSWRRGVEVKASHVVFIDDWSWCNGFSGMFGWRRAVFLLLLFRFFKKICLLGYTGS